MHACNFEGVSECQKSIFIGKAFILAVWSHRILEQTLVETFFPQFELVGNTTDQSSRPWRNLTPPHGSSTWRPADQRTTRRSTWTWCLLNKTIQEIRVDRRFVGWSAGRHVDHPCGGQVSPWPATKVTELRHIRGNGPSRS